MGFGTMLKDIREKAGISQSALAELSGLPLRTIQNWEQGRRVPRMQRLPALAKALEVPIGELVAGLVEQKLAPTPTSKKKPGRRKPKGK